MPKRVSRRDQYDIRGAWTLRSRGYTIEQAAEELGISPRTVNNYLSKDWLEERKLAHLAMSEDDTQDSAEALAQLCGSMIQQHILAKSILAKYGIELPEPNANSLLR